MADNRFILGVTDQGPPRAAKGGFPYPGHGTLAETAVREAMGRDILAQTPFLEPGRYLRSGPGRFTARCGHNGCKNTLTVPWGQSGSAAAPGILRKNKWIMHGVTNRARWFCPHHGAAQ